MKPTIQELNKKVWYRLLKVIAIIILIGSFIAPWVIHKPNQWNQWLFIDGCINVVIWLILIYIIQHIILYVLYGKETKQKENGGEK